MLKLSSDKKKFEFVQHNCHTRLNRGILSVIDSWGNESEQPL